MEYRENVANIAEIIGGGTPKTSVSEYWNGNIPWISIADFNNDNKFIYETEKTITELGLKNSSTKMLRKGDIIISARGTVGKIGILGKEMAFNQSCYGLRAKEESVRNEYLYYTLKNSINYIKSNTHGSVFDTITRDTFNNIKIDLISIDKQNKLVKILGDLDKKIELNNQINDSLYNISKNIFRNFYNNNAGKWQVCKINDIGLYISDYVANGSFKSLAENVKIYDDKSYALFIRNTDLKVNFTQGRKYVDEHSYNFLNKSKLYGRELIISNVGDVGSIFLCPSFDMPMTLGNNVIMVDSKDTEVNYNYYLYYYFLSVEGQYLIDGITGGSVQPKFNKTDFRNSQIELPSKEEIMNFNNKVIPMYDIIEKNIKQNETLEQIRDTLLPKLINGEIDLYKIEI